MEGNIYELVIVGVIFTIIMAIVFIAQFVLIIHNRNFVRKRDEANQKRYEELSEQITETQKLFRKEITTILDNFKRMIK